MELEFAKQQDLLHVTRFTKRAAGRLLPAASSENCARRIIKARVLGACANCRAERQREPILGVASRGLGFNAVHPTAEQAERRRGPCRAQGALGTGGVWSVQVVESSSEFEDLSHSFADRRLLLLLMLSPKVL